MHQDVAATLAADRDAILQRLCALLRLPSVSADPAYAQGMADTRAFLLARLNAIGLQDTRLLEPQQAGGQPVVYGSWTRPDRPTLILYGHYDVQPPDPLGAWTTPPFEPTVRDGRLYARGAADVKGTTTIAIETVAAFLAQRGAQGGCPVGVKLFLEGEEEVGSPSLPGIVAAHRGLLAADGVVSADGGRVSLEHPAVNVGCRGLVGLELALSTAARDLHSGRFGGTTRNALHELAALVASLHDAQGRIAVPGFAEDVRPPTPAERQALDALPLEPGAFYAGFGGLPHGDPVLPLRERITLQPTLEVNGLWGGYTGEGGKTVIPHQAFAKLTGRLAPGQDPARVTAALERHLRARCAPGVRLELSAREGNAAYTMPPGHPMLLAAERVLGRLAGRPAVHARIGGTLPISAAFRDGLGLETLMFGFADPDGRQHAPDEFMRLSSIDDGLRAWPMLLAALGEVPAAAFHTRQEASAFFL